VRSNALCCFHLRSQRSRPGFRSATSGQHPPAASSPQWGSGQPTHPAGPAAVHPPDWPMNCSCQIPSRLRVPGKDGSRSALLRPSAAHPAPSPGPALQRGLSQSLPRTPTSAGQPAQPEAGGAREHAAPLRASLHRYCQLPHQRNLCLATKWRPRAGCLPPRRHRARPAARHAGSCSAGGPAARGGLGPSPCVRCLRALPSPCPGPTQHGSGLKDRANPRLCLRRGGSCLCALGTRALAVQLSSRSRLFTAIQGHSARTLKINS